jgi:hypothetical protein
MSLHSRIGQDIPARVHRRTACVQRQCLQSFTLVCACVGGTAAVRFPPFVLPSHICRCRFRTPAGLCCHEAPHPQHKQPLLLQGRCLHRPGQPPHPSPLHLAPSSHGGRPHNRPNT